MMNRARKEALRKNEFTLNDRTIRRRKPMKKKFNLFYPLAVALLGGLPVAGVKELVDALPVTPDQFLTQPETWVPSLAIFVANTGLFFIKNKLGKGSTAILLALAVGLSGVTGCVTTKHPDGSETTQIDVATLQVILVAAEEGFEIWKQYEREKDELDAQAEAREEARRQARIERLRQLIEAAQNNGGAVAVDAQAAKVL